MSRRSATIRCRSRRSISISPTSRFSTRYAKCLSDALRLSSNRGFRAFCCGNLPHIEFAAILANRGFMFVELVLTLWGKPRLGLPKKRGLVIKRAERDETARPGVRAGGFPLSREASSRLNVAQQNRFPRDARADSGTGERRRPIQTPRHRPRAPLHRPISLMCHSVLHWVEDGFLARRGASKEGGHAETNEESARLA